MTKEKTSHEIMLNYGRKLFERNKKWIPSDMAILVEDVEKMINNYIIQMQKGIFNIHCIEILRILRDELKSRGR